MTNYNVSIHELRDLANKVFLKELTWEEYMKYNVVLDLNPNHSSDFINALVNKTCVYSQREWDNTIYRGPCESYLSLDMMHKNDFRHVYGWSDHYRNVFISEKNMTIVTACEGEISVVIYDNINSYNQGIEDHEEFYKKY